MRPRLAQLLLVPCLAITGCLSFNISSTPPDADTPRPRSLGTQATPIRVVESAAIAKGADAMPGNLKRDGGKVWIEGIETYRVIDPMFEGVRLILASRGGRYSSDYIQGISGSAFRIGGICPCAPTCENAMWPQELLRLLGYEIEHVKIEGEGDALKESTRKAVARVKQEIDAGRAVLVWHAFTNAEWDIVYGYDAEKKQLLGRGSYAGNDKSVAAADEMRTGQCGEICCPAGVILIGRKTGQPDAAKAEVAALKEAVRHARDQKNVDKLGGGKWVMLAGLACYDRWVRDFGKPDKKREVGDAYCYGVYRSTHAAAAGFLREIAPKHPAMSARLKCAADHFQAEAETLAKGEKLLWWNSPAGPDPKRNAEAAALLKQARDAYAAGIAEIEKALAAEGVEAPAPTPPEERAVIIKGVPTLAWGKGKECTFCGALEAALAVSKHPHSYTDLMAYSGMAFRVRWYRGRTGDKHCPSCAVGHADGGRTLLFHDYFRGEKAHEVPAEKLGALLFFLTEPRETPARRGAVLDEVRQLDASAIAEVEKALAAGDRK